MIDKILTIKKFGYNPNHLTSGSGKKVVCICNKCGKIRDIPKQLYRDLCKSCIKKKYKGNNHDR
jgi:Fe2+ or Zn2+ uptake regulation protein